MSWSTLSHWLGMAGAAAMLAFGYRWAFHPERVVANASAGPKDPQTVRRFGYALIVLGAAILVLKLFKFISE